MLRMSLSQEMRERSGMPHGTTAVDELKNHGREASDRFQVPTVLRRLYSVSPFGRRISGSGPHHIGVFAVCVAHASMENHAVSYTGEVLFTSLDLARSERMFPIVDFRYIEKRWGKRFSCSEHSKSQIELNGKVITENTTILLLFIGKEKFKKKY